MWSTISWRQGHGLLFRGLREAPAAWRCQEQRPAAALDGPQRVYRLSFSYVFPAFRAQKVPRSLLKPAQKVRHLCLSRPIWRATWKLSCSLSCQLLDEIKHASKCLGTASKTFKYRETSSKIFKSTQKSSKKTEKNSEKKKRKASLGSLTAPKERFNTACLEVASLQDELRLLRGRMDDMEDCDASLFAPKKARISPKRP